MADKEPKRTRDTTIEARENTMINLAMDLAEKQLRDGTASSQVMTHYLKLGSPREQLERSEIRNKNDLARAKIDSMESGRNIEELYESALLAMSRYQGNEVRDLHED